MSEIARFHALVDRIEAEAPGYAIGALQTLRAQRRGGSRSSRSVLSVRSDEGWAYHWGGRRELQFNVGLDRTPDGTRALRAGVGFSLEPSQSLPNVSVLYPKMALFDAWVREHADRISDMRLWWYDKAAPGDGRSLDNVPQPIDPALRRPGVFVFLGARQPLDSADPHAALLALDRLLPLWRWIEDQTTPSAQGGAIAAPAHDLHGGRALDGDDWVDVFSPERRSRIERRHRGLQRRLKGVLEARGFAEVTFEHPVGVCFVDVSARKGAELWYFEVKAGLTVRWALREAVGQLLEYALWRGGAAPARLVVVGEDAPTAASKAYLARLNASFPVPIEYWSIEAIAGQGV